MKQSVETENAAAETRAAGPRAAGGAKVGGRCAPARRPKAEAAARPGRPASGSAKDGSTRSGHIRAALRREILSGRLAPGTKLHEEALGAQYGASRTPVREALQHLASEDLVELRARQGAFVARPSISALVEMFDMMACLEADCAALAARRHTVIDRDALTAAHVACKRAARRNDPEAFCRANATFHECVYRASHNSLLETYTLGLRDRLEPYRRETTFHAGFMALSLTEHEAIMNGIFAMDSSAARAHMHGHLDSLRNDVIAMIQAASLHSSG
jgi:DNA-binding GntR family transcriptional regulator